MSNGFSTDQIRQASPGVFDAQKDDLDKTIEVLESSKEDLQDQWVEECFDVVVEAMKEKRAMH